jgi:hypothetical protein
MRFYLFSARCDCRSGDRLIAELNPDSMKAAVKLLSRARSDAVGSGARPASLRDIGAVGPRRSDELQRSPAAKCLP